MSFLALIHIFSAIQIIKRLIDNENNGNTVIIIIFDQFKFLSKFSIISISIVAIWDMYICIFNFLFSIKFDVRSYFSRLTLFLNLKKKKVFFQYFAGPSFFYFILFTVFETRLIMMIWKSRYFPGQAVIFIFFLYTF